MPEPRTAAEHGQHEGVFHFLRWLSWTAPETERQLNIPDVPPEHVEMVGRFMDAKLHVIAHGLIESDRLMPAGAQDAVNHLYSVVGPEGWEESGWADVKRRYPGLAHAIDRVIRFTSIPDVPPPDRTKPEDL